jgi:chromosome partitioning protein
MCTAIAITGFTRGVGRTSLTTELAKIYATLGKRVLVIDTDGNGDLGRRLEVPLPTTPYTIGLCDAMVSRVDPNLLVEKTAVPNLSVLGAGDHLGEIDDAFMDRLEDMPKAAQRAVDALRPNFDVLLLDTPADCGAPATLLAPAAADVSLALAPRGNYGLQPAPEELQDTRIIRQEGINSRLEFAGTVIVEPGPGGRGVSSKTVAEALAKLGRFIDSN